MAAAISASMSTPVVLSTPGQRNRSMTRRGDKATPCCVPISPVLRATLISRVTRVSSWANSPVIASRAWNLNMPSTLPRPRRLPMRSRTGASRARRSSGNRRETSK